MPKSYVTMHPAVYSVKSETHPFLHPNNREERNRIGERIRVLAHPFYDYVQWTEGDLPGLRDFARRLKEEVDALVELLGND